MFLSSDSLVINLLPLVEYVFALRAKSKGLVVMAVNTCMFLFSFRDKDGFRNTRAFPHLHI